ncbi:hypothetical protein F5Y03DRAFT_242317 [Xylaria venustula]|nr:hypothetical protein F5Y03DRAFT_242317 [Xylaria venustula]
MAPKTPTKDQHPRPKSSKGPRLNSEAKVKKRTTPAKSIRPISARKVVNEPVYSPNINSSEMSDLTDDEEPRHIRYAQIDGTLKGTNNKSDDQKGSDARPSAPISIIKRKTPRQLRADRRATERRGEDFTDDEKQKPKPMTTAKGEIKRGSRRVTFGNSAEPSVTVPAGSEDVENELDISRLKVDSQPAAKSPTPVVAHGPDGNAGVAQEPLTMERLDAYMRERLGVPAESASSPGDIAGPSGAAARYLELLARQQNGRVVRVPSSSSSSSSSAPDSMNLEVPPQSSTVTKSPILVDKSDGEERQYSVYQHDAKMDAILVFHLRRIGRALSFMIRAKASGIEVGDFDSLAAVSREKWEKLTPFPENAVEALVQNMLSASVWDIILLSGQAGALQDDLLQLGITIE